MPVPEHLGLMLSQAQDPVPGKAGPTQCYKALPHRGWNHPLLRGPHPKGVGFTP